jgi:DNA binding domain, excisionase family
MSHTPSIARNRLAVPINEVAELLGVSNRHVRDMLNDGRLGPQPLALGTSKRWRVAELEEWLAAGCPNREAWKAMQDEQETCNA